MNTKGFLRWAVLALLLLVLAGWGMQALADPDAPAGDRFVLLQESPGSAVSPPVMTAAIAEASIPFSTVGDQVWTEDFGSLPLPAASLAPQQEGVTCKQFLLNSQLDVLELGDGTGRAEPWVVYDPIVYYSSEDYVSPNYSLVLVDADTSDSSPTQDAFAQAFYMPTNLVTITIRYYTAMENTNSSDRALGSLWTVDAEGNLDLVLFWEVGESLGTWQEQTVLITDPAVLAQMAGQQMAIILFSQTDGNAPGEMVWFDDVRLTACVHAAPYAVYLPLVLRSPSGTPVPVCRPPSENPQDTWNANRGYVECNATCQSTLSRLDLADYYTFVPSHTGTGNCTLYLRNLPAGTEWSAMIFVDQPTYPPPYAPGPVSGQCRIATPGSGDKSVTCPLTGGASYFVKVSAGSGYTGPEGGYQMQVTCPTGPTPTPGWITIVSENFEGSFPGVWSVFDNNGASYGTYYWGKHSCRPYAGSYSGWAVGGGTDGASLSCGSNYPNYANSWMRYGPFSLVGATAAELRFKLWLYSETRYDWICSIASPDGTNWDGPCTSGDTGGWVDRVLNLANVPTFGNLLGQSNVWVALWFFSDSSVTRAEGAYVDDIVLRKCTHSGGCAGGASLAEEGPADGEWVELPARLVFPGLLQDR